MENLLVARFDVFPNAGAHAGTTPYLVDVQTDLLDGLDTCVVVPLRLLDQFANVKLPARLSPVFRIEGRDCSLEIPRLAAVPRRILKNPVMSLASEQSRIVAALDFLFQGY